MNIQDLLNLIPVAVGCDGTIVSAPPIEAFVVPEKMQSVTAVRQ